MLIVCCVCMLDISIGCVQPALIAYNQSQLPNNSFVVCSVFYTKCSIEKLQLFIIQGAGDIGDVDSSSVLGVVQNSKCALRQIIHELLESIVEDVTRSNFPDHLSEIVRCQVFHQPGVIITRRSGEDPNNVPLRWFHWTDYKTGDKQKQKKINCIILEEVVYIQYRFIIKHVNINIK